jgi:predicted transcriptional regulator
MTVYGGNDDWKARVGFSAPHDAYLVLIDRQGIVRWLAHGRVSDARLQELAVVVDSLPRTPPDQR